MNKHVKSILIVLPISCLLCGLTVLLCLLDSKFEVYYIAITVILAVWAFFMTPSFIYAIDWAKRNYRLSPAQSFRFGFIWGELIFILLILAAPFSGTMWFINIIKNSVLGKNKISKIDPDKSEAENI